MLADAPAVVQQRAQAVGIGEREYRIAVYRPRVHPGALKLNVRNLGEDDHDLVVRHAGRRIAGLHAVVRPGRTATLRLTLRRPGRYDLVCTVADHESRGMRATLRVVAR
jgi:plastocyanin